MSVVKNLAIAASVIFVAYMIFICAYLEGPMMALGVFVFYGTIGYVCYRAAMYLSKKE